MSFAPEGSLTTDSREVAVSETWESQTDWEAAQASQNIVIENGVVKLAQAIASEANDKLVHRWVMDEGTGSTVADNEGTADGTINGNVAWVSGSWAGDFALDSPGNSGDYVELTTLGDFGSAVLQSCAFAFSIQTTEMANMSVMGTRNSGSGDESNWAIVRVNQDESNTNDLGKVNVTIREGGGSENRVQLATANDVGINDGNPHRVVINVNDTGQSDVEIAIDGSTVPVAFANQGDPTNLLDFDEPFITHATNNQGSIENFFNGTLDDVCAFDSPLTSEEIGSYAAPWS